MGKRSDRGKFSRWIGVSFNAIHRGISYFEAFGEDNIKLRNVITDVVESQRVQLRRAKTLETLAEVQDLLLEELEDGNLKNWDEREVRSFISFVLYNK